MSDDTDTHQTSEAEGAYWRDNVRLLVTLMAIWFACSFGAGILFREFLDQFMIGGYPKWKRRALEARSNGMSFGEKVSLAPGK